MPPDAGGGAHLWVVGTPIGNLQDITARALEVLGRVPVVAAEDTRQVRKLLTHFELRTPPYLVSYREENRHAAAEAVMQHLREGREAALVTDAGMPGVSDPGDVLVALCHAEGIPVSPVPGPSAALAALAASGIPSPRFTFEGFLSRRASHRREHLHGLAREPRTMIFFESPHRVAETMRLLVEALGGQRRACVAREITKKFEEIRTGTLAELAERLDAETARGEFTLVVAGWEGSDEEATAEATEIGETGATAPASAAERVAMLMAQGMSHRDAAREVARQLNLSRREVYRLSSMGPG